MKVGDKIIVVSNYEKVESLRELVIKSINLRESSLMVEDGQQFYIAYCWPLVAKDDVLAHIEKVAAAKKVYDDIAAEIFSLRNRYS